MKREELSFFALLRAGLWNRPVDAALFSDTTDWDTIFKDARRQTVLGLVGEGMTTLPAALQPPASLLNKIHGRLTSSIRMHALLNRALVDVVALFVHNHIRPVLLKGQGVALNYVEPTRRQCGDIDLYIGTKDYDRACELVRQHYGVDEHGIESEKHYHFKHQGVILELHRIAERLPLSWQNSRFQRWTVEHLHGNHLRAVDFEGTTVYLPPVDFDALYIFNHAWHHFMAGGGIGLRQLCDWARFLHTFHGQIDHRALRQNLQAFGLWRAWRMFGCVVVGTLGLPKEEFPFYTDAYARQAERILDIIGREGNFGFFDSTHTERPEGYVAGKLHSFIRMHRRFGRLLVLHFFQVSGAWSSYLYKGVKQVMMDKLTTRKRT